MALSDADLKRAARSAYERARWTRALAVLVFIAPATFLATHLSMRPGWSIGCGVMLACLCVYFRQRGGDAGRSVTPGLCVGFAAAASAIGMCHLGFCGPGDMEMFCGMMCLVGATSSGVLIVFRGSHLTAALVAFTAASLGCAMFGVFGIAGLALGFAAGALPARIYAR